MIETSQPSCKRASQSDTSIQRCSTSVRRPLRAAAKPHRKLILAPEYHGKYSENSRTFFLAIHVEVLLNMMVVIVMLLNQIHGRANAVNPRVPSRCAS